MFKLKKKSFSVTLVNILLFISLSLDVLSFNLNNFNAFNSSVFVIITNLKAHTISSLYFHARFLFSDNCVLFSLVEARKRERENPGEL